MVQKRSEKTRAKLIQAGTEVIRRQGYVATTVDQVCVSANVSKGAFFHHFKSKEQLAESCLLAWDEMAAEMESGAPFHNAEDPVTRVEEYMEFFIGIFENPNLFKSCLAGVAAQEVAETSLVLRNAANRCFCNGQARFQSLLDEASSGELDTASLAAFWQATMQGALVLAKASRNESVISESLRHVQKYISSKLSRVE